MGYLSPSIWSRRKSSLLGRGVDQVDIPGPRVISAFSPATAPVVARSVRASDGDDRPRAR